MNTKELIGLFKEQLGHAQREGTRFCLNAETIALVLRHLESKDRLAEALKKAVAYPVTGSWWEEARKAVAAEEELS